MITKGRAISTYTGDMLMILCSWEMIVRMILPFKSNTLRSISTSSDNVYVMLVLELNELGEEGSRSVIAVTSSNVIEITSSMKILPLPQNKLSSFHFSYYIEQ